MPDGNPNAEGMARLAAVASEQPPTGPHLAAGPDDAPRSEAPSPRIGPYKLLQKLGEGGMGSVYLAEQAEPVRRQVALKVIKPGMDSRQILVRFDAERQALALMDHPNIARVFDAGTTDGGAPYFAMELVKGLPITRYCDQERLSLKERLALFVPVCQAVQHAHQKGIIHRDLKPSNVLIALYDGRPVPKVIDFGLAKATRQKLTEKTLFTEIGTMVGTLEYMAPEQAELNNLDIDTRADIYALGVLLYELLTGTPPFTRQQLRSAEFTEMLRIIREVEPPRPSTRLSSSADLPTTAARRKLEPKALTQFIRGDLDWIVMKCLNKERGRRYETANGLAMDVQRFLNDEPVLARPPSAGYRVRKFVRRNRGPVLAASVILLALVAGVIGTAIGLAKARRAEAEAVVHAHKAEQAAASERKANELLQALFAGLDPRVVRHGVPDIHAQLIAQIDEAAAKLERDPPEPLTHARLQYALGQAYSGLGERQKSVPLLERALKTREEKLDADHADTLQNMESLADAYWDTSAFDKSLALREKVASKRALVQGENHADTLRCVSYLGNGYRSSGKNDKARNLLEPVLQKQRDLLGPDHADTLLTMLHLGNAYRQLGKPEKALPLLQESFERRARILGPTNPHTLQSMHDVASTYVSMGKRKLGVEWYEKALAGSRSQLGEDHPSTLFATASLGTAYRMDGQAALALKLLEPCWEKQKAKQGPGHRDTLRCMFSVALAYRADGQPEKGLDLLEKNLEKRTASLGPDHVDTLGTMQALAEAYVTDGRREKGLRLLETTLEKRSAALGPDHRHTLTNMYMLASEYRNDGALDKASLLFEKNLGGRTRTLGAEHGNTLATLNGLALVCNLRGDLIKGEGLWRQLLEVRIRQEGPESEAASAPMLGLGENLIRQNRLTEAEDQTRACLRIRDKLAPDAWPTFHAKSLLGEVLLAQEKYADAELLLRAGYEGLKKREALIPAGERARVTAEAVQRLVEFYTAWGKPDEAARWHKERERIKPPRDPK